MLTISTGTACAGPIEDARTAFEPGDYATALRLFGPLAENANVQTFPGGMYLGGMGVPQDDAEAVRWFRKAADQGDAHGLFLLCNMYFLGKGVPQDYAEAASWFRKAAEGGDAEAQTFIGGTYFGGIGVPQDDVEAAKWFRKAADQGYPEAQALLGGMDLDGHGLPQDYVQAYKWWSLAASRFSASEIGNRAQAVRDRGSVAAKMSLAQIAEAQKLAREWKPK